MRRMIFIFVLVVLVFAAASKSDACKGHFRCGEGDDSRQLRVYIVGACVQVQEAQYCYDTLVIRKGFDIDQFTLPSDGSYFETRLGYDTGQHIVVADYGGYQVEVNGCRVSALNLSVQPD